MSMYAKEGICVVIGGTGGASGGHWFYVFSRLPAIEADPIILGDIVAALCYRVGLTPAQIDVSDLTTEVRGFVVNQRMSARAAIEALMRAFNFDAAESGDQIIFRLRGTDSVLTLTADDLGAEAGGQSDAALWSANAGRKTNCRPKSLLRIWITKRTSIAASRRSGAWQRRAWKRWTLRCL